MSPANMEFLLWCYYSPDPHPKHKAYEQKAQQWAKEGILTFDEETEAYSTTELGAAWVRLILSTPVPVFADPRTKELI